MKIEPANDQENALRAPFSKPAAGATLRWYIDAPQTFYSLYLVRVVGLEGDVLAFHFLDFGDAHEVPGGPHRLDLNDARLVWRKLPSTVEGARPPADCGFLFLQEDELARLAAGGSPERAALAKAAVAARDSRAAAGLLDTGKYPRSAALGASALTERRRLAQERVTNLRKRLETHPLLYTKEVAAIFDTIDDVLTM